jgi:ATP-dependent Lon protease
MDGLEQFVPTPELQSEDSVGDDPLPSGQAWVISPGGMDENPGLFRVECNTGPGSGVKILNQPPPGPLKESVRCAEQNLYAQSKSLVGDRDPRSHEYTLQVRAFDSNKSAAASGVGILLAMCSSLLGKNLKGGLVVVGGLNLGGSVEPLYSPVVIAELAIEKGAKTLLVPVSSRKQMNDLADDQVTKLNITYYTDAKDALMKALSE